MRFSTVVACIGLSSLFFSHHAIAKSDHTITYKNQRGSVMVLEWHGDAAKAGNLTGTFTTAVGCKENIGVPMPLTGYFNGNAISIAINFSACKATVGMTGKVSPGKNHIDTLWLTAYGTDGSPQKTWNTNIVGADSFEKI